MLEESGGASGKESSVAGAAVPPVAVALGQPEDVLFLDILQINVIELISKVSMSYGLNFDVASCFGNYVSKGQKYCAVVTYKECQHATKEE